MSDITQLDLTDDDVTVDLQGNDVTHISLIIANDVLISKGISSGKYYYHNEDNPALITGPYDTADEAYQAAHNGE